MAKEIGGYKHYTIDAKEEFANEYIARGIKANAEYEGYPLSTALARPLIAQKIIDIAKKEGATAIAHGCTGKGNDQVRFDLMFQVMCPKIEIITPIRDLSLSREDEIQFLKNHNYEMDFDKAKYSINKGLWGTSVGGKETLTSQNYLPEEAFPSQIEKTEPSQLEIEFKNGELFSVNGETFSHPVLAIQKIEELASP